MTDTLALPVHRMDRRWFDMYPFDGPYDEAPLHRARAQILAGQLSRFQPGRLADLGCGSGYFAQVAAQLGWRVVATDARPRPWQPVEGVTWRTGDVRDAPVDGFDVVLMMGIFYHLDLIDQVRLLRRCCGTPLVIDTHLSVDGPEWRGHYRGETYEEAETIHSSSGNPGSWWPTLGSMLQLLEDCGYGAASVLNPWYQPDRTFITALP